MPANEWTATQGMAAPERTPHRVSHAMWKKLWLCCGLLLSAFSARAEAPTPPREFWDYLMEFGDEQGGLFDPNDLDVTSRVQVKGESAKKITPDSQPNDNNAVEQQRESHPAKAPVVPVESSQ